MSTISERVNTAISMAELERRWASLRAMMEREGIDVLVAQNNNDHMGGPVKYLTDNPATNGYPMTVVLPRDDDMTVVRQGPRDGVTALPHEGNGVFRGVKRLLTTPNFVTAHFTAHADADLVLTGLAPYARGTIGIVGPTQMSYAMGARLREALPDARFVDATEAFDQIKGQRSDEEIVLIRRTAEIQDAALHLAFSKAEPGMRESDVAAIALNHCQRNGGEQGIFMCASGPAGTPMRLSPRHQQNRVLRDGDQFVLLVETNGPGGLYAEIGRTLFFGPIPTRLEDEFGFTLEARHQIVDRLVPGADPAAIFARYGDFMHKHGRPEDKRLVGHAQGYDMVERPLIRDDETMVLSAGMNMAVHPTYVHDNMMSWICDNYLIAADGPAERLHRFPEELVSK